MNMTNNGGSEVFGFKSCKNSAHFSRTMMFDELYTLLDYVPSDNALRSEYLTAIEQDNCLGKRSVITRRLSVRHLSELYALDSKIALFRTLRYFWQRDEEGRPLLALLCAYARDPLVRLSASFISSKAKGQLVKREELEDFIEVRRLGLSRATLKSLAQNLNGTWTKSGHLWGKRNKIRSKPMTTAGAVAYALLLGYLSGARGIALFATEYCKLLECTPERLMEFSQKASRSGWLTFNRVGDICEVLFPNLLTPREMELLHERNQRAY